MRIDKLLWFLRFAMTRGAAQRLVGEGHIRRNGERVTRLDQPIAIGDVLTIPRGIGVAVIEIAALPGRRGPAAEAQAHYHTLDAGQRLALAGAPRPKSEGRNPS